MSLAEVQQRTSELQAHLRQLSSARAAAGLSVVPATTTTATTAAATATATDATTSTTSAFATQLAAALAPTSSTSTSTSASSTSSTPSSSTSTRSTRSAATGGTTAAHSTSPSSPSSSSSSSSKGSSGGVTGEQVLALAKKQLGTPYVWGGEQPGGFDCSGLIQWTYSKFGIDLPRVSTDQAKAGKAVDPEDARPGDLVFFERGAVDHIGMYAGHGTWVVAPQTGDVVKIQKVDLDAATTIRRIVPSAAARASSSTAAARSSSSTSSSASNALPGLPAAGKPYAERIVAAARAEGVDPKLLAAVAWSESGFKATARSGAGAVGLMQLMPRTAAGLGVDPTDPAEALRGGAKYLKQQLNAFGGREDLALAAYNAGPGAVRKYGGIPPYSETQGYVKTVLSRYAALGGKA